MDSEFFDSLVGPFWFESGLVLFHFCPFHSFFGIPVVPFIGETMIANQNAGNVGWLETTPGCCFHFLVQVLTELVLPYMMAYILHFCCVYLQLGGESLWYRPDTFGCPLPTIVPGTFEGCFSLPCHGSMAKWWRLKEAGTRKNPALYFWTGLLLFLPLLYRLWCVAFDVRLQGLDGWWASLARGGWVLSLSLKYLPVGSVWCH